VRSVSSDKRSKQFQKSSVKEGGATSPKTRKEQGVPNIQQPSLAFMFLQHIELINEALQS
jgi:hypothetical protein